MAFEDLKARVALLFEQMVEARSPLGAPVKLAQVLRSELTGGIGDTLIVTANQDLDARTEIQPAANRVALN